MDCGRVNGWTVSMSRDEFYNLEFFSHLEKTSGNGFAGNFTKICKVIVGVKVYT